MNDLRKYINLVNEATVEQPRTYRTKSMMDREKFNPDDFASTPTYNNEAKPKVVRFATKRVTKGDRSVSICMGLSKKGDNYIVFGGQQGQKLMTSKEMDFETAKAKFMQGVQSGGYSETNPVEYTRWRNATVSS